MEIGNWVWNQVWRVVSVSREGYRCKSQVQLRVMVKLKLGGLDGLLLISRGRRTRGLSSHGSGEGGTSYESSTVYFWAVTQEHKGMYTGT